MSLIGLDWNRIIRPDTGTGPDIRSGFTGTGTKIKCPVPVHTNRIHYYKNPVPVDTNRILNNFFRFKPEFLPDSDNYPGYLNYQTKTGIIFH